MSSLLGRVANLLIDADVPVAHLEEISRLEFVRAAVQRARRPSGTVNRSKIAAITGLTRPEVTRLIGSLQLADVPPLPNRSRAARVVKGWLSDARFHSKKGAPARLPFAGSKASFTQLVRLYAGDVPPRAILDRLELLGLVARRSPVDAARPYIELKAVSRRSNPEVTGLAAAKQLLDCIEITENCKLEPTVLRVDIPVPDPSTHAAVLNAATEKTAIFLQGIRDALASDPRKPAASTVQVVVAIAPKSVAAPSSARNKRRTLAKARLGQKDLASDEPKKT